MEGVKRPGVNVVRAVEQLRTVSRFEERQLLVFFNMESCLEALVQARRIERPSTED